MKLPYKLYSDEIVNDLPVRIDHPLLARDLTFITTTQCNIECSYCYNFHAHKHIHLSPALALGFLKSYLPFHCEEESDKYLQVTFTGGEPTINPDPIFAVVDYLNEMSIDCIPVLLTNGIMPENLLKRFIEQRFLIQLSYDGGENTLRRTLSNKSTHNNITTTFDKLSQAGAAIILRPTVTQHNVEYLTDIVKFAGEHGVCGIIFDTCDMIGNALKNQINRADAEVYVEHLFDALEVAKESNLDILIPELMRYSNQGNYKQLPKLCLLPEGIITTTTKYLSTKAEGIDKAIIGNFSLENGLEFYQDRLDKMVSNVLENLNLHCRSCESVKYCRGRNQNLQLFREQIATTKDEYRCDITRNIFRKLQQNFIDHSQVRS